MKAKLYILSHMILFVGFSQSFQQIDSLLFDFSIASIASDPLGKLYLGSNNGDFVVVDSTAKVEHSFFLQNQGNIHSIAAWNPLRIFIFSREIQTFWFLERFSADPRIYTVDKYSSSFVLEMTPGQDHSFWLVETTGSSLKKINETSREPLLDQPLINLSIGMPWVFKSYKNLLIILDDQSVITLLDPFGNVVDQITGNEITYVQVRDDQLHYIEGQNLIIRDVYKKTPGNTIALPGDFKKFQRISPSLFYFVENKKIKLYRYIDR